METQNCHYQPVKISSQTTTLASNGRNFRNLRRAKVSSVIKSNIDGTNPTVIPAHFFQKASSNSRRHHSQDLASLNETDVASDCKSDFGIFAKACMKLSGSGTKPNPNPSRERDDKRQQNHLISYAGNLISLSCHQASRKIKR